MDDHSIPHDVDVDDTDQLIEMAELFSSQGCHGEAAGYLRAALRAAQAAGNLRSTLRVWDLLAYEHARDGDVAGALRCARSLLSVADALGCEIDRVRARFRLVETWTTNPEAAPGLDPFPVIAEIDHLVDSVTDDRYPDHAIRRGRLVAEVLTAQGRLLEAATAWGDLSDVAAAVGERAQAFECRCHEVQCRLDANDIAGTHRGFCTLLVTLADIDRREAIEWAVLAASEHFLLREDEEFWAGGDGAPVPGCPVDLADLFAAQEEFFSATTNIRRRAHFLGLRALVTCDTELESAQRWIAEASELMANVAAPTASDLRIRGVVKYCGAHVALSVDDTNEARRLFMESTVDLARADSPVLAKRAAGVAATIDGTQTEADD